MVRDTPFRARGVEEGGSVIVSFNMVGLEKQANPKQLEVGKIVSRKSWELSIETLVSRRPAPTIDAC